MKTKPLKEFPTYYPDMKDYITSINENQSQNRKLNASETVTFFYLHNFCINAIIEGKVYFV
ncbi:hypothetical protein C6499_19990 [Candidatus Poribacteria bacterium]|nr:MAG: hypothetical protein C6499_19990 [Candidatus Poribacteria bacterium]